jgi:steroid 5-alpha reductase family enzyme
MWVLMIEAAPVLFLVAVATWLFSLFKDDVSVGDYSWSIMVLATALIYAFQANATNFVSQVLLLMVAIWAFRLSAFLIKRRRNQPEDRRYSIIRKNNSPNFPLKSFYLIFMVQGFLVWIISASFVPGFLADARLQWSTFHTVGVSVWLFGLIIETVADNQLHRFNQLVVKERHTLNTGLWRYSRHPNYFGEFCVWWGWCLFAVPAFSVTQSPMFLIAPAIMTALLIKVSGIRLMERDMVKRRPDYQAYKDCTSSFFPLPPLKRVNDL